MKKKVILWRQEYFKNGFLIYFSFIVFQALCTFCLLKIWNLKKTWINLNNSKNKMGKIFYFLEKYIVYCILRTDIATNSQSRPSDNHRYYPHTNFLIDNPLITNQSISGVHIHQIICHRPVDCQWLLSGRAQCKAAPSRQSLTLTSLYNPTTSVSRLSQLLITLCLCCRDMKWMVFTVVNSCCFRIVIPSHLGLACPNSLLVLGLSSSLLRDAIPNQQIRWVVHCGLRICDRHEIRKQPMGLHPFQCSV